MIWQTGGGDSGTAGQRIRQDQRQQPRRGPYSRIANVGSAELGKTMIQSGDVKAAQEAPRYRGRGPSLPQ